MNQDAYIFTWNITPHCTSEPNTAYYPYTTNATTFMRPVQWTVELQRYNDENQIYLVPKKQPLRLWRLLSQISTDLQNFHCNKDN